MHQRLRMCRSPSVAHRLKTVRPFLCTKSTCGGLTWSDQVIDYDRLIVLDKGVVAEFDTPLALIEKEDGIFRQMCLQSGMFVELEAAARARALAARS
jgi:hypothetical protein